MTHYHVILIDGTTLEFDADRCRDEGDFVLLERRTSQSDEPWAVVCEVHRCNLHRIDPLGLEVNPLEAE